MNEISTDDIRIDIDTVGPIRLSPSLPGLTVSLLNTGPPTESVVSVSSDGEVLYTSEKIRLDRFQSFKASLPLRSPESWLPSNRPLSITVEDVSGRTVGYREFNSDIIPSGWIDRSDSELIRTVCTFLAIGPMQWSRGPIGDDISELYDDLSSISSILPDNPRFINMNGSDYVESSSIGTKIDIASYAVRHLVSSGHSCLLIQLYNDYIVGVTDDPAQTIGLERIPFFFDPCDPYRGVPLSISLDKARQTVLNNRGTLRKGRDWYPIIADRA